MSNDTLLILLLTLPFAGSLAAVLFPANARNAEAWLAGAVASAGLILTWAFYPAVADGAVIRAEVEWLPSFGLNFTLRMDGTAREVTAKGLDKKGNKCVVAAAKDWRLVEATGTSFYQVETSVELGKPPPELRPPLAREPRAHLAGEPQLVVVVDPDGERSEVLGVPLAGRPAADDELLLRSDLDLQPGRRAPAGLVRRATQLREDPFEAQLRCRRVERPPVAFDAASQPAPASAVPASDTNANRGRMRKRGKSAVSVGARSAGVITEPKSFHTSITLR